MKAAGVLNNRMKKVIGSYFCSFEKPGTDNLRYKKTK